MHSAAAEVPARPKSFNRWHWRARNNYIAVWPSLVINSTVYLLALWAQLGSDMQRMSRNVAVLMRCWQKSKSTECAWTPLIAKIRNPIFNSKTTIFLIFGANRESKSEFLSVLFCPFFFFVCLLFNFRQKVIKKLVKLIHLPRKTKKKRKTEKKVNRKGRQIKRTVQGYELQREGEREDDSDDGAFIWAHEHLCPSSSPDRMLDFIVVAGWLVVVVYVSPFIV